MKIIITAQNIEEGKSNSLSHCAFSLAFKDALSLDGDEVAFYGPTVRIGVMPVKIFSVPENVAQKFERYLRHGELEPFSFEIDLENEVSFGHLNFVKGRK